MRLVLPVLWRLSTASGYAWLSDQGLIMNRLRLQILVNGRQLCVAGLEDTGSLVAKVEYSRLRRPKEPAMPSLWADLPIGGEKEHCDLEVSGSSFFPSPSEILQWLREPLSLGDEITIRILGPGQMDEPRVWEPDEPF